MEHGKHQKSGDRIKHQNADYSKDEPITTYPCDAEKRVKESCGHVKSAQESGSRKY